ncbi:MAG: energy transducer TonB [Aquificaceae bacterium]
MATNIKLKAYTFSLFLHLSLLFLFLFISQKSLQERKIIEIDLSLSYVAPQKEEIPQEPLTRQEKPKAKVISQAPKNSPVPKEEGITTPPMQEKVEELKPQEKTPQVKTQDMASASKEESTKGQGQTTQEPTATSVGKINAPVSSDDSDGALGSKKGTIDPKQAQDIYLREKLSLISFIVQKHISYPPLARRMGWEGKVVVCFTLTAEGELKDLHIEKSSGYEFLDKNAMETVKKVAHLFPKPPVDVVVKLPVNYRLE